jgi:hypothetical protein
VGLYDDTPFVASRACIFLKSNVRGVLKPRRGYEVDLPMTKDVAGRGEGNPCY